MACLPTEVRDELEFVHAMCGRSPDQGECRGPLLRLVFWPYRLFVLENILDCQSASDLLWDGFSGDRPQGVHFELCAAHWMDLVILCALQARRYRRQDWLNEAQHLLDGVCSTAGWDPKEIANMFAWQRERLT